MDLEEIMVMVRALDQTTVKIILQIIYLKVRRVVLSRATTAGTGVVPQDLKEVG